MTHRTVGTSQISNFCKSSIQDSLNNGNFNSILDSLIDSFNYRNCLFMWIIDSRFTWKLGFWIDSWFIELWIETSPHRTSPLNSSSSSPLVVTFGFLVDDILEVDEEFQSIVIEHKMSMRWVDWRVGLADWADNVSTLTHEQMMIDRSQRYDGYSAI